MSMSELTDSELAELWDQAKVDGDRRLDRLIAALRKETAGITAPETATVIALTLAMTSAEDLRGLLQIALHRLTETPEKEKRS